MLGHDLSRGNNKRIRALDTKEGKWEFTWAFVLMREEFGVVFLIGMAQLFFGALLRRPLKEIVQLVEILSVYANLI